jgi:hypothetical protein
MGHNFWRGRRKAIYHLGAELLQLPARDNGNIRSFRKSEQQSAHAGRNCGFGRRESIVEIEGN